jgi:hexosaminidase
MIETVSIVPKPVRLAQHPGEFPLGPGLVIAAQGAADGPAWHAAGLLAEDLSRQLGAAFQVSPEAGQAGAVHLRLDPDLSALGAEGYRLVVTPAGAQLSSAGAAGLFYATRSLLQMLPVEPASAAGGAAIACVEIEDYPRFGWRGAMLDVCRHFMPLDFVYRFLDLMALHKLNSFHWHLTEDHGWRIEIKKYPRLTEVGAWRKQTVVGFVDWQHPERAPYDGLRHGGFYTQDEIRAVVAYAAARSIRVVPEIEMPGHAQAAIAAYPQLGNTGAQLEVSQIWGVHEHVYNVEESTLQFLQDVLSEVLELFPGQFIHVGGDECPKVEWKASPRMQARMAELGLKDEDELQSYVIRRMDAFLAAKGRRLIGWDEILEGGLAPGAAVMSWRGEEGGILAANAGHDVVMAPTTHTYLDYHQVHTDTGTERGVGPLLPLSKVYSYNPIPAAIDPARVGHVLGVQGQLWSEHIHNPAEMEYMAFPRLCALAEVAWTPQDSRDLDEFLTRLDDHTRRLDRLQVRYCPAVE